VLTYHDFDEYAADCDYNFIHYFVSAPILFAHTDEFETLKDETFVIVDDQASAFETAGYQVLDVRMHENEFVSTILRLHEKNHPGSMSEHTVASTADELSARERDVLALIVKGYINKEIADRLNISTTTAIFHRNRICEKLGTRSIGKLTVYAVLMNIVTLAEI